MSNRQSRGPLNGHRSGKVLNVGYGNFVMTSRIIAVLDTNSLPVKRLRERACDENCLVDATAGRKMRSLVIMDAGQVVLSALAPATLQERVHGLFDAHSLSDVELEEGEFVS